MHGRMRARILIALVILLTATFVAATPGLVVAVGNPTLRPAGIASSGRHTLLVVGGQPTAGGPATGFPQSWGLTHRDLLDIGAGLAIVVLLLVVLAMRIRRRRGSSTSAPEPAHHAFPQTAESWRGSGLAEDSTAPLPHFEASSVMVPTVGPGWHPVQGDPTRVAYWDGASWSAFRQWDGQQWVDPTSIST
jgi:hypothetical protein